MMKKYFATFLFIFSVIFIVYFSILLYPFNKTHIIEILSRTGMLAPFLLIFFHSFQVIVAPIPGQVFPFLMGFLYGVFPGIVMAILGNLIGSFVGYYLGRMGEEHLFHIKELEKFEKYRERLVSKSIIWLVILFILPVPGLPKDLLCYFAGLIGVKSRDFIISVLLGRSPVEILWVLAGAGVYKYFVPPV